MKFFSKGELTILWPFYLGSFIAAMFSFFFAFEIIYFIDLGYSMFQISILIAAWPLFSLISDIPTGAIADLYGRKFSVLLGTFLVAIGFLLLYFFTDYFVILGIMAFIGISYTFISGSDDAWVTDLVNKKDKKLLHRYFAKTTSLASAGIVIAGLIGTFFVKTYGINIIWLASSISYFASFFSLLFAKENYSPEKSNLKNSVKNVSKKVNISIKYSIKNRSLFYMLLSTIILIFIGCFNTFATWTPLLKSLNYPNYAFGYLISAMGMLGIIASLVSIRLLKHKKERKFLIYSFVAIMVFIIGIIFANSITFVLIMIFGLSFFQFLISPVKNTYFQRFIPTKLRATIGSIKSIVVSLAGIIALPIVGLLVDNIGPKYTIFISGFMIIPVIFIYYHLKKFE